MNPDSEKLRRPSRALSLTAHDAVRPALVPMLGAALGLLYVLIHNLLSLI